MGRSPGKHIRSKWVADAKPSYEVLSIEIDSSCCSLLNPALQGRRNDAHIKLHDYKDIPLFLQHNPHIRSGYRATLPFSLCIKSLLSWNNETINIWSHLIGFLTFFILMIYDNVVVIPDLNGTTSDHIIITGALLCSQFCMVCSAGYHLFACHSEKASRHWLQIDLAGICFGVIGCYIPGVHYAFYCRSIWRDLYIILVTILSLSVLCIQLSLQMTNSRQWTIRVLLYFGLVAYGLVPTIHWIYLSGGWSDSLVKLFVPKVTVMYSLGIFALIFYVTKFPEKYFPGKFDFIGSSHQIWHVIILAALYFWHHAAFDILQYRILFPCESNKG